MDYLSLEDPGDRAEQAKRKCRPSRMKNLSLGEMNKRQAAYYSAMAEKYRYLAAAIPGRGHERAAIEWAALAGE